MFHMVPMPLGSSMLKSSPKVMFMWRVRMVVSVTTVAPSPRSVYVIRSFLPGNYMILA